MFLACKTYEKQLRIEKTRLSHQVWSHGGSTFKKNMTLNGHFSRPAETDPYVFDCMKVVSHNGQSEESVLCHVFKLKHPVIAKIIREDVSKKLGFCP